MEYPNASRDVVERLVRVKAPLGSVDILFCYPVGWYYKRNEEWKRYHLQ